jgi:hypothetical protein
MIKHTTDAFYSYFVMLIHPFKTHEMLRQQRMAIRDRSTIIPFSISEEKYNLIQLKREEVICFSWIMEIISAIYTILSINLGISALNYFNSGSSINSWIASELYYSGQVTTIAYTLLTIVLFPVTAWIYIKVWEMIVVFFMKLFEYDELDEYGAIDVVTSTLSSNILLIVPLFGGVLAKLYQLLLFFAGLKSNLGMNTQQSILVLMAPIFLLVVTILFLVGYVVLMFTTM